MIDPKIIRTALPEVAANLKKRGIVIDVEKFQELEEQRKALQVEMQNLQNERNTRSKAVGLAKAQGKDIAQEKENLKSLSDALKSKEEQFAKVQTDLEDMLSYWPNMTHSTVPEGKDENDNALIRSWGEPKVFSFEAKDHVALSQMGQMDFETAAKIAGSRFVILRGSLARLQRALIQFMLDLHTQEHGYQEIYVPYLVNAQSLYGTGQFPKLREDVFAVTGENEFFLIPTSEVSVTNTVRDQILNLDDLPIKYVCYSTCFRSEAGSYGKDIKGMLRQHQFEKVELVQIVHPDNSYQALEEITNHAETVLKKLDLPYRVMALCTGDIGFYAAKTYDLEVWLPGQQRYREISSCSNTESFQARRLKARFRDDTGKTEYVHTLNGSGLAVGRTLIAIMENYQDECGKIHIPAVLQPYMNGAKVIE